MLRIIYLAWGQSDDLHTQARYSILSAQAWSQPRSTAIHVFTNATERYPGLAQPLPEQPTSSPFELKLLTLRTASERWPDDAILFVDADTFFIAPAEKLADDLQSHRFLLHRREYYMPDSTMNQTRRFRRALRAARVTTQAEMWNSGVVGLPPHSAAVLQNALETYAKIAPHTPKKFLAEQYALSLAIQQQGAPIAAEDTVFHYWYQKPDYTRAIREQLELWKSVPEDQQSAQLRAAPIVLKAPPLKRHWWERALAATGLRKLSPDSRGLPKNNPHK